MNAREDRVDQQNLAGDIDQGHDEDDMDDEEDGEDMAEGMEHKPRCMC